MAEYTLKDENAGQEILRALNDAAINRAVQETLPVSLGKDAPTDVWTLGTAMWTDGVEHLPSTWKNETVPKDLYLRDVPTLNIYKAIVEQIQGALVATYPTVEFSVNGKVRADLNEKWEAFSERSRLLSEYDLVMQHGCNYGIGWLGLHRIDGALYGRAVHPQRVLWPQDATRFYEMKWVAKIVLTTKDANKVSGDAPAGLTWPSTILPLPDKYDLTLEVWVLKGATLGNRKFEKEGMRFIIDSTGKVKDEEPYKYDVLPLVPFVPLPAERLIGQSMASLLWQAQVRADKILAAILSRVSNSIGGKYIANSANKEGEPDAHGQRIINTANTNIKRPGVQIISLDNFKQYVPPEQVPADLLALYERAIEEMEYISGISRAFQGMVQGRMVSSAKAINALASLGSKRINRMATHFAEAIKDFAKVWAVMATSGQVDDLDVDVALEYQHEDTRQKKYEAIVELKRAGVDIPSELIIDAMPGLDEQQKKELISKMEEEREAKQILGAQQSIPGAQGQQPQQPPMEGLSGAGEPPPAVPMEEGAMMEYPAGAPPAPAGEVPMPVM